MLGAVAISAALLVGCTRPINDGLVGKDTPLGVTLIHQRDGVEVSILTTAWRQDWFAAEPCPGQQSWNISLFATAGIRGSDNIRVTGLKPVTIHFVDDTGKEVKRIDLDPLPQPDPPKTP